VGSFAAPQSGIAVPKHARRVPAGSAALSEITLASELLLVLVPLDPSNGDTSSMKRAILSFASLALLTFATTLRADTVLTTVTVGPEPTGIAANPATNKIYVAIDATGEVAVINGKTQQVTARLIVGRNAIAIAVNPFTNRIYASGCDSAACNIWVIDGKTDTLLTNIPINSGDFLGIQALAVNPVTDRVYASDADNQQLIVIDGKTNTIVTQVFVPIQPAGIGVNPRTNRIYVGNGGFPGKILVFDGATNTQIAEVPESSSVQGVATNFRLNRVYGTVVGGNVLSVIDGSTNQEATEVPTGRFPNGVDVNLFNNKVYVADSNDGDVTIIDGNTNQVLQTVPLLAGFPNGVAVNLATGLTYITDFNSDRVIVLQPN
jgi:YVTN family beta-propeller protein